MKIEVLNGLGEVVVMNATRVLVTMDDGTPAMVASEWMSGEISCSHAGEAGFGAMLTALGVDRTVVVSKLRPKDFDQISVQ